MDDYTAEAHGRRRDVLNTRALGMEENAGGGGEVVEVGREAVLARIVVTRHFAVFGPGSHCS